MEITVRTLEEWAPTVHVSAAFLEVSYVVFVLFIFICNESLHVYFAYQGPLLSTTDLEIVKEQILKKTINGLKAEGWVTIFSCNQINIQSI